KRSAAGLGRAAVRVPAQPAGDAGRVELRSRFQESARLATRARVDFRRPAAGRSAGATAGTLPADPAALHAADEPCDRGVPRPRDPANHAQPVKRGEFLTSLLEARDQPIHRAVDAAEDPIEELLILAPRVWQPVGWLFQEVAEHADPIAKLGPL